MNLFKELFVLDSHINNKQWFSAWFVSIIMQFILIVIVTTSYITVPTCDMHKITYQNVTYSNIDIYQYSIGLCTLSFIINVYVLYNLSKYIGYNIEQIIQYMTCHSNACRYSMILYLIIYIILSFIKSIYFVTKSAPPISITGRTNLIILAAIEFLNLILISLELVYVIIILISHSCSVVMNRIDSISQQLVHSVDPHTYVQKIFITNCAICDINNDDVENIKPKSNLECGHIFDKECIDHWPHQTCPICRKSM